MVLAIQIVKNVLLQEKTTYVKGAVVVISSKELLAILHVKKVIMVIPKIPIIQFVENVV